MNYAPHYEQIISRARGRRLTGYTERHHVVPRCMGGTDAADNIVELTAEEHYVAHQLLVKMHPDQPLLATAAVYMAKQCTGNKAYGWLRRRHADRLRGKKRPPRSEEWKRRIGAGHRGRVFSPEHRAKLSAARRAHGISLETGRRISAALKGRKKSPAAVAKLAAALRGYKHSPETRAKVSASLLGNRNAAGNRHWLGRRHSDESIARISQAKRGKPWTAARRAAWESSNG